MFWTVYGDNWGFGKWVGVAFWALLGFSEHVTITTAGNVGALYVYSSGRASTVNGIDVLCEIRL